MNNCEQNAIVIVRNNDTDFNGANFLTINLETEILDLSTFKAVLNMSGVIKEFNDLSSGSITVNLTAQETKNLPPFFNGVLNLIDSTNKVATIESLIPFKVISTVHNNAIATEPYTLNFDVKQGGETILTVNVESAVSVEVGTTTTLPAGSDATVTNSGTLNHLILDFGIPQGAKGDTGASGKDGQDGKDGVNGTNGQDGTNATITGATASVTNTVGTPSVVVTSGGTASARSFNFAFSNLKGEKGDMASPTIVNLSNNDTITLAYNSIYNGSEIANFEIVLPSVYDVTFICQINFTSGGTATTITYPNTIKWVGEDIASNVFTPVSSKRYTIIIYNDGAEFVGVVKGIA